MQTMNRDPGERLRKQLVGTFQEQLGERFTVAEAAQLTTLLEQYYRHVPEEDLEGLNVTDLVGAVVAHWQLLKERPDGAPRVRVYNPTFEEHGWECAHTVIEVVSDDMAFLVDSLSMALNRAGLTIQLTIHPVVWTRRDRRGRLRELLTGGDAGRAESMIAFQVERQTEPDVLQAIEGMLLSVIRDIGLINADWLPMRQRVRGVTERLRRQPPPVEPSEREEVEAFLEWLENDHFTFLAWCEYDLSGAEEEDGARLALDPDSLLGLFRDPEGEGHTPAAVVPLLDECLGCLPGLVVVTKANARSRVHRPAYMDFIGIKRFDERGRLDGFHCIVGLFALSAYSSRPLDIPLLRRKVERVVESARLSQNGHSGRMLMGILDTFPRDALFQIDGRELTTIALGILGLQERQRTRLFLFRDAFGRFYSCLVFIPRERYNRELRLRIQKVLVEELNGLEVEFSTRFSESVLARIHYVVRIAPEADTRPDPAELERRVIEAAKSWQDGLQEALLEQYGEARGARYFKRFSHAFPGGYREDFYPRTAASDVARIEHARRTGILGMHFYRPIIEGSDRVHFRLYAPGQPISLSEAIPILENMGLTVYGERPYQIRLAEGDVWIHDFSMGYARGADRLTDNASDLFQDAFRKVWEGLADNDGFNRLVLDAGLSWREVTLLRAYSRYLQQIRVPYSQAYIVDSLTQHPGISRLLIDLYRARFDPDRDDNDTTALEQRIDGELEQVASLDQDRILRGYVRLVLATLRSNFFQCDAAGEWKEYVAFKIDPSQVPNMPLPLPMFEIFVFSARMEGVHLRGGRVARGGLRWSDRMEDFRTEVLGLMKAQMVKNTVIVPVGSKGGFIVKRQPPHGDRDTLMREVVACYRTLLCGLLDLTDNLVEGAVVPPPRVVRYDDDDPYLVIAADKGTATFSDIANGVAAEYGFWLGDAFASGGSAGYDHKKMGITARGAWESVKRHFRELGVDIQTTPFRVVGIGDMSGDVFGNGMLLSRHIRLVGAFNHQHIFLDPDPDPERSFEERQRLFRLPRSSWKDYDKSLISSGGGIWSRGLKSIPLSDEVKALLGLAADRVTPNELISALLKAPVDLLWNGGIGTYVKSEQESHAEVADKANDGVRVNGRDLRCKVVGEGGNLGFTQLGRVEFALRGGLIYTDAIDNSAGVDCSDHEVNIKILLGQVVAAGEMTGKQRNRLLEEMTDEVAQLVLADNYAQTQAISMIASEAPRRLYEHARFIEHLEQRGLLNRELEYLPDARGIAERGAQKRGLTRPEIAVLHAYSKMNYYDALIQSGIPDDEYLQPELLAYFPQRLGERFRDEMGSHRLRREIIATHLTNDIVDHVGPGFGFRVRELAGANIAGVTRAYLAASRIFGSDRLWHEVEALDNRVPAQVQLEMMRQLSRLLEYAVVWILLHYQNDLVVRELVERFQPGVTELFGQMPRPLAAKERLAVRRRVKSFANAGVPRELAQEIGALEPMAAALDIVDVTRDSDRPIDLVTSLYFNLGTVLDFHWLRAGIDRLDVQTHWHNLAKARLKAQLDAHQRQITAEVLASTRPYKAARRMIEQWTDANRFAFDRYSRVIEELKARTSVDYAMLSVAVAAADGLRAGGH